MKKFAWLAVVMALSVGDRAIAGELLQPPTTEDTLSVEPARVVLAQQSFLFVRLKTVRNTPESTELISSTFKRIWAFAAKLKLKVAGSPMEIMRSYEESDGTWLLWAAIPVEVPVAGLNLDGSANAPELGSIGGDAVQAAHRGDHAKIKDAHHRIASFLSSHGLTRTGFIVEQHFDNPHTNPPEKLRSSVTYFLN